MNMKKFVASLTAASLCLGAAAVLPKSTSAADTQYRIMCVGDSITHGYINGDNGYRKYLCYYLQQNGISYDMVGPENNWTDSVTYDWNGTTITYDPAHCGYSGYSTMTYSGRTGIYETLFGSSNLMETYDPDMVLLQIGTNDLLDASLDIRTGVGDIRETTTALNRLETVVDKILENMDSTDVLFVTTIPDIDANTCASWVSSYQWIFNITADEIPAKVQECVDAYNAGVKTLVSEKQAEGWNIQFGDINSVIDYTAGDLEDGCHPSEQGYAKMGAHWAEQITAYLNGSGAEIIPPTTEETTESTSESDTAETETDPPETTAESTESTTTETTASEGDSNITQGDGNSWTIDVTDAVKVVITAKIAANSGANGCIGYYSSEWIQENWEGAADADGNLVYELEIPEGVTSVQYQIWWPSEVESVSAELIYEQDATEPASTEAVTTETTAAESTTTETETTATETTAEDSDPNEDPALGDVNFDGNVNVTDVIALTKHLLNVSALSGDGFAMADMNQDSIVNAFDLALLKRTVLSTTPMPL